MPKRGNGGRGRWSDGERPQNNYHEHDDRRDNNARRVSFKPNSYKNKNKPWNAAIKKLEDDDIDMNDQAIVWNNGRNFRGRGGRGGGGRREGRVNSPVPRQGYAQRRPLASGCVWYQVSIPYGQKQEKNFILKALLTYVAPDIFIPHYYTVQGHTAMFYVDDFKMADKLANCDRQIPLPNGYNLIIRVKPGTPQVNMDPAFIERMKTAMGSRYNPATKALDLTKFHSDPALVDVFCPLFRPSVMMKAIEIMEQNIPDLVALNLNDNNLQNTVALKNFTRLPHLTILYLANNKIRDMGALDTLKSLNIKEMYLEANPIAEKSNDKEKYIRDVQRKFPKLQKLDGVELPPVIGFDVADETSIPPQQPSFLCNTEGQAIIHEFLKAYYSLYDSGSRQPLLDAYHENAIFSLSASYAPSQNQNHHSNKLNSYLPHSRNLMRSQDRDVRSKQIKVGRLQVVSFINDLPKTQHDLMSFTLDLTLYTPTYLLLTVNGVFKEVVESTTGENRPLPAPCRAFQRSMIIVPYGSGFCIQNDILYITNATIEQEQNFMKGPPARSVAPAPVVQPSIPVQQPGIVQNAVPTQEAQQQLIQAVAMQTNMNLQWSMNCLEQTNWDLNRAMLVFTELHKQGSIPPEAFVK